MIARMWHGYTTPEKADAYEATLKPELLPASATRPEIRRQLFASARFRR